MIVVVAILAVMILVLAPKLLSYNERSRAEKDNSSMDEVVNAIQLALADQEIYDEVLRFSTVDNISCYVDTNSEANYNKIITKSNPNGVDQYTFLSDARQLDETPYFAAGNMRGVTITFAPDKGSNGSDFDLKQGVVNQYIQVSGNQRFGAMPKLYNRVRSSVGDVITNTSQTYRNSEYTVFIVMGTVGGNDESAQDATKFYGQWSGTNLPAQVSYQLVTDRVVGDTGNTIVDIDDNKWNQTNGNKLTLKPGDLNGGGSFTPTTSTGNRGELKNPIIEKDKYKGIGGTTSHVTTQDAAMDGDASSFWETEWNVGRDMWYIVELDEKTIVDALYYLPRWDNGSGGRNGFIEEYLIETSIDGASWTKVAEGSWYMEEGWKVANFTQPIAAKFVRLTGVKVWDDSPPGNNMSIAEIRIQEYCGGEDYKSLLKAAIRKAKNLYANDYVNFSPVRSALYEGEAIVADIEATKEMVDTATNKINKAIAELVPRPTDPSQDDYNDRVPVELVGSIYAYLTNDNVLILRSSTRSDVSDIVKNFGKLDQYNNKPWSWGDFPNIHKVNIETPIAPVSCAQWFQNCENLIVIENINNLDTSNVVDMSAMFQGCKKLESLNVVGFDTNNVTRMENMFNGCSELRNLDVSNFKTQNVTNMSAMFLDCGNLEVIDVRGFDTKNVTNFGYMFRGCASVLELDVRKFDTSKSTSMRCMFMHCAKVKELDLSNFKTGNVTDVVEMFAHCTGLEELNVDNFNTEKVEHFGSMFSHCCKLKELNLSSFSTSNAQDLGAMFRCCCSLTELDVSHFDTSNVVSMWYTFSFCSNLKTINLGNMNSENVEDITYLFQYSGVQTVICSNEATIEKFGLERFILIR